MEALNKLRDFHILAAALICAALFFSCSGNNTGQSVATGTQTANEISDDIFEIMVGFDDDLNLVRQRNADMTAILYGDVYYITGDTYGQLTKELEATRVVISSSRSRLAALREGGGVSSDSFFLQYLRRLEGYLSDEQERSDNISHRMDALHSRPADSVAYVRDSLEAAREKAFETPDNRAYSDGPANAGADKASPHIEGVAGGAVSREAYMAIGKRKELFRRGIIKLPWHLRGRITVNRDAELAELTPLRTDIVRSLEINRKNAVIVSPHPEGSYRLVKGKRGTTERLDIIDVPLFWRDCQVLVICHD